MSKLAVCSVPHLEEDFFVAPVGVILGDAIGVVVVVAQPDDGDSQHHGILDTARGASHILAMNGAQLVIQGRRLIELVVRVSNGKKRGGWGEGENET